MSRPELEQLRLELERAAGAAGTGAVRRAFRRLTFEQPVTVTMYHPGGAAIKLRYMCRNLSRGGLSLLHSAFVHADTACSVELPAPGGGVVPVTGRVVRCRHVAGKVHEVGVRFDRPVNVRGILGVQDPAGGSVLEQVDPNLLAGTLLLISGSDVDSVVVRQFLAETDLSVIGAPGLSAATARLREKFDVILSEATLPDGTGVDVVRAVREAGLDSPVVLMTADPSGPAGGLARRAGADGLLIKPLAQAELARAIGEALVMKAGKADAGWLHPDLPTDHPMTPHVPVFLEQVRRQAEILERGHAEGDAGACRRAALEIRGGAATFGLAPLGVAADRVCGALDGGGGLGGATAELRALLALCRRVRAAPPARAAG